MDLKRASLGYHRNSIKMAERFFAEACKRKNEIDTQNVAEYIKKFFLKFF